MAQNVTVSLNLPVLGAKTYTFPVPDGAVIDELEKLDGGTIAAKATVKPTSGGVAFSAEIDLPVVGAKTISEDLTVAGFEQEVVDGLLSLDGNEFDLDVSLAAA